MVFFLLQCYASVTPPGADALSSGPNIYLSITGVSALTPTYMLAQASSGKVVNGPKTGIKTTVSGNLITEIAFHRGDTDMAIYINIDNNKNGIVDSGDTAFTQASLQATAIRDDLNQERNRHDLSLTNSSFQSTVAVQVNGSSFVANTDYYCIFSPTTMSRWQSQDSNIAKEFSEWSLKSSWKTDAAGAIIAETNKPVYVIDNQNYYGSCILDSDKDGSYSSGDIIVSTSTFNLNSNSFSIP